MIRTLMLLCIVTALSLASDHLIAPIPNHLDVDPHKAELGKKLFFDTRLSVDNRIACASCHHLTEGGDDNLPVSFGVHGHKGTRNAPTVYNAVFDFRQFWDGRAKDLQEQARGPIENPVEMAHHFDRLIPLLQTTDYAPRFQAIYPDGITPTNIANALAEYEKTLITPNAPFDRYLRGDKEAISPQAKVGYTLFKTKGCILCHQGMNIGGSMYNKFGIFVESNLTDMGRFAVTHKERDRFFFKVPSLRNIDKTAPYFHDGHETSLRKAVLTMSEYQLGRKMTQADVDAILAFLHTLDGQLPEGIMPQ